MASNRKRIATKRRSASVKSEDPDHDTLAYKTKRANNNLAVKKARQKKAEEVGDAENQIKLLEKENCELEAKIASSTKNVKFLIDCILQSNPHPDAHPPQIALILKKYGIKQEE